jgi:hypothetical protein
MDLLEVGCDGMDWVDQAHYRDRWQELVNAVISFSGRTLRHVVSYTYSVP